MSFYNTYYPELIKKRKDLQQHKNDIKNILHQDPDADSSYTAQKKSVNTSIRETVISANNAARQLENLLTGFKTIFLKALDIDFVQRIVVEEIDENKKFTPIILQLESFQGMSKFISDATSQFQGKLKSNQKMLNYINSRNSHTKLFTKLIVTEPYIKIYQESRRRLNIFYEKTNKSNFSGEGLLLYKPEERWISFFVLNLGDLKEGYVSMTVQQPQVNTNNIDKGIQTFTGYIGKVDNIAGTLWQDIQDTINNFQISVKSGSAQTGSHEQLISLIELVSKGNFQQIRNIYEQNKNIAQSGVKARDRIYTDNESKEKIASMIFKRSKEKTKQKINYSLLQLQKAGDVLVSVQNEIEGSI